jgi:hypothetical protein
VEGRCNADKFGGFDFSLAGLDRTNGLTMLQANPRRKLGLVETESGPECADSSPNRFHHCNDSTRMQEFLATTAMVPAHKVGDKTRK